MTDNRTKRRDLPAIKQTLDPDVRDPLRRTAEEVQNLMGTRGDPMDRAVRVRDLFGEFAGLGLGGGSGGGSTPGPPGPPGPPGSGGGTVTPDLTPPPTVTGLTASAGFTYVTPAWDAATYTVGHGPGQTNIYAARRSPSNPALPTFGDAQLVGTAPDALTLLAIASEPNQRWHIWAKWQTKDGVESVNPAGGTNGVTVTTGQDISQLLAVLTGKITESQLFSTLGARIALIDAPAGTAGSVNARIAAEAQQRVDGDTASVSTATTLVAQAKARPNLLRNGGFERGLEGWIGDTSGFVAQDGSWGRAAVAMSKTGTNSISSPPIQVQAGAAYTISGDSLLLGTAGAVYFKLVFFSSDDAVLLEGDAAPLSFGHQFSDDPGRRLQHQVSNTAPAGATYARAQFIWNSVSSGSQVGARLIKVERGALPATTYTAEALDVQTFAAIQTVAQAVSSGDAANASQITTIQSRINRVSNYLIRSRGFNASLYGSGVFDESGAQLAAGSISYNIAVFNNGVPFEYGQYNLYNPTQNASFVAKLNSLSDANAAGANYAIAVFTDDEPQGARGSDFFTAMKRCGATQVVLDGIRYRGAYILIGVPGFGEGTGIERYAGPVDASPLANCEFSLQFLNGRPVGLAGAPGTASLSASIQQEATTRASVDGGLLAQYTVKVDVNGYVSGFGLASTANNGPAASSFFVRADNFAIASPSGPGISPIVPFIVQTTPGTINGVSVPVGVYMDAAYILNGSITNAKIGTAVIDDAKIANLSAAKLTVGDGTIGGNLKSANYASGLAGWLLQPNGNAEFQNGTFRGTVYASAGSFAGDISAASGNFRGAILGGAYTGYAWPPAGSGNIGFYLGPSGLLLGNANNGKYFQVAANGDVSAPGFSIINGTLSVAAASISGTLTSAQIGAGTITTDKLVVGSLTARSSFFRGLVSTAYGNQISSWTSGYSNVVSIFSSGTSILTLTGMVEFGVAYTNNLAWMNVAQIQIDMILNISGSDNGWGTVIMPVGGRGNNASRGINGTFPIAYSFSSTAGSTNSFKVKFVITQLDAGGNAIASSPSPTGQCNCNFYVTMALLENKV